MADQAANNGGSQAAGGDKGVSFSRSAAQRIAKVVRTVEGGDRGQPGLTFEHPTPSMSVRMVRRATFSGAWEIGATKVVTFVQAPTATANAINLTWPLTDPSSSGTCLVGKEGTNWWLIVPSLSVINCNARATPGQLSFFSS